MKAIIFAAPSGSGKTTIVNHLLRSNPKLRFSISSTTRIKRPNEIDGKDYHFISNFKFNEMVNRGEFMEYQQVYDDVFYGTPNSEIQKIWDSNCIVVFDVDVVGGLNLKKIFGKDALSIFIKPPSIEVLKERLINRKTETEDSISTRINKAQIELGYQSDYDHILVNDNFDRAISEVKKIISTFIDEN